jgi:hypothetical protein
MQKTGVLFLCLSVILIFGSLKIVEGQETDGEMIVPMGIIQIGPPEEVEPTRSPVDFPHSRHFANVVCKTCHHDWNGTEVIKSCTAAGCHDLAVSPIKSGEAASDPGLAIRYYKTGFHKLCLSCHKEKRIENKKLEMSDKELKEKLIVPGPTSCIGCHPKPE